MAEPVIAVRELSKRYRLGDGALKSVPVVPLRRLARKLLGRPPIARKENAFWALDKVSFEVMPGDRVGIVGRNGAGKSTLLKILSRVVPPTSGEATIRGRLTSLLEVGTGFNESLSGRDNVYLNASLHGLHHDEIEERFDDIVAFSEIGEFINTPVNHYSSGMRARLAFAVAAHLDPDIMMLDEVLSVGDLAFQRKCLARMEDIMDGGRALLFVSHSIDDIRRYCDKAIWLDKGKVVMTGTAVEVTETYATEALKLQSRAAPVARPVRKASAAFEDEPTAHLLSARVALDTGQGASIFSLDQVIAIEMEFRVEAPGLYVPSIVLISADGIKVLASVPHETDSSRHITRAGTYRSTVQLPPHFLNTGTYHVNIAVSSPEMTPLKRHFDIPRALSFHCVEAPDNAAPARGLMPREFPGLVRPKLNWRSEEIAAADASPQETPASTAHAV